MPSEMAFAWCQECKCWVPASKMNYFDGNRVCQWCLDGVPTPENYVRDIHREDVQCIYCDSWDTVEQKPNWGLYKCNQCGETFRRVQI